MAIKYVLPESTHWSAPFWDGATEGKLLYQYCTEAQKPVMYPKRLSPFTLRDTLEWRESAGKGSVYTFTVQRLAAPGDFAEEVPYAIAVIQLDEGFQMMSNLIADDYDAVQCGDRVSVEFEPVASGGAVPVFRTEAAS